MIEESFVSFEIAVLLKEKGFDEPCHCYYNTNSLSIYPVYGAKEDYTNSDLEEAMDVCYSAPTQQMACRWLREVHNIHITVLLLEKEEGDYGYTIEDINDRKYLGTSKNKSYNTHKEACEAAIKHCLENLI